MSFAPQLSAFAVFFAAALVIALTPGPGIFYVGARTLAGGREEGMASSLGTGLGGLVHVIAGAVGLSAVVMASAEAFTVLKIAGALYLIWLGINALRQGSAEGMPEVSVTDVKATGVRRAFREGVLVEATNPKTAVFFLAFIPQFIDAGAPVAPQFIFLGLVSVVLNTLADVGVVFLADRARRALATHPTAIRRMRQGSGAVMLGLGAMLLLARKPG
ncbi:MAG: LysE family translocator [Alphaproteobacteria bacterium]|nr:LysE family translocator [Alphaproteobacteria bacterium]